MKKSARVSINSEDLKALLEVCSDIVKEQAFSINPISKDKGVQTLELRGREINEKDEV